MNDKVCQSCALPLNGQQDLRGSNSDGTKSTKYCAYCYSNGNFIYPTITYQETLEIGLKKIEASTNSKFKKWMFKKTYPTLLKKCERWTNVR